MKPQRVYHSLALTAFAQQVNTWKFLKAERKNIVSNWYDAATGGARPRTNQYGDVMTMADVERHSTELLVLERSASSASTFALDGDIADAIYASSLTLPLGSELRVEDLVERSGFVWSGRPLRIPPYVIPLLPNEPVPFPPIDLSGFCWEIVENGFNSSTGEKDLSGVFILFLGDSGTLGPIADPGQPLSWIKGIAVCAYSIFWRFGDTIDDMWNRALASPHASDPAFLTDEDAIRRLQYFYAFNRFVQTKIMTRHKKWVNRQHQHWAAKLKYAGTPVVDVVELRARMVVGENAQLPEGDERRQREWSCRWLVRGHWRQQYYPSLGVHKPIWIEPYDKGPENKPLKVEGHRVFTVVR